MSFGPAPKKSTAPLADTGLSKETQKLLEDVMNKRGLSLRATQDVAQAVKGGNASWVDSMNTGTAAFNAPPSKKNALVKVPKVGKPAYKPMPGPPASFSGKRMNIPTAERDMWVRGAPAPDREAEKDRCAQVMELGAKGVKELAARQAAEQKAAQLAAARAKPLDVREALIDQLVQEIQERREFLESMRAVGRAGQYEEQMKAEIAERMHRLRGLGVDVDAGAPAKPGPRAPLPPWQRQQLPGGRGVSR